MITLYLHQQKALDLTAAHNRCAYYLDMGLGKTFVGSEKMMALNTRINLLVCQCSKVPDWVEHFQTHYTRNCVFDLTSEQFGDEALCYEGNPEQFREVHFGKEEKRQRYEYLKDKLRERFGKKG